MGFKMRKNISIIFMLLAVLCQSQENQNKILEAFQLRVSILFLKLKKFRTKNTKWSK